MPQRSSSVALFNADLTSPLGANEKKVQRESGCDSFAKVNNNYNTQEVEANRKNATAVGFVIWLQLKKEDEDPVAVVQNNHTMRLPMPPFESPY